MIIRRTWLSTTRISWIAIRPRYPVLLHFWHPIPRFTLRISAPIRIRSRSVVSTSFAQSGQTLRSSLWATSPAKIEAEQPDILILDIEMPQKSGIEIKNELTKDDKPLIIFATAYFEFMKEAFGKNVIGYMQKPVKKFEFDNYMKTAIDIISLETTVYIDDTAAVKSSNILMINADRGYTEIELVSGQKKTCIRKSLKAWEEELGQYGFMRINDGCIINSRYVREIDGGTAVIINTGAKLKVSRRRKTECAAFFRDYSVKSSRYI